MTLIGSLFGANFRGNLSIMRPILNISTIDQVFSYHLRLSFMLKSPLQKPEFWPLSTKNAPLCADKALNKQLLGLPSSECAGGFTIQAMCGY